MVREPKSPYIFEASWEVCNQVGGIYTVVRTKALAMREKWGTKYFLLGPYIESQAALEFEETPPNLLLRYAFRELEELGIRARSGRWLIEGRPQTILLDSQSRRGDLPLFRHYLQQDHGITAGQGDVELDNCLLFCFTAADFFRAFIRHAGQHRVVAHCHEWQAGLVISRLRFENLKIGRVFTTHATLLGRYIAGDNPTFYEELPQIDPLPAARYYGIEERHLLERLAVQDSHVFTAVSAVTGVEASRLLGRSPDAILPNGLSIRRFAALHEFQNLHQHYKGRIHEFIMGQFFPSYAFDLDRTLYLFISGRYEYRNKGIDVFLDALYLLNQRLKEISMSPTVVGFIITKAPVRSINVDALRLRTMFEDLRRITVELEPEISRRVLGAVASGRFPDCEELMPGEFRERFRRAMHARRITRHPSVVTHELINEDKDPILRHIRERGFNNSPEEPVKIIYHPEFLTETSVLFGLEYDHFVRGCHLGVFPSFYEPWGYTPLECIALGVPAVTSDCSGFGQYVNQAFPDSGDSGIYVLKRLHRSHEEAVGDLAGYLFSFALRTRRDRIELRSRAERMSDRFDWSEMTKMYFEAEIRAAELA